MKRIFVAIAAVALTAAAASAQDFNAAVDAFNAGVQALETNKKDALDHFREAFNIAGQLGESEAQELADKCKELIPGTLLSIAKEQINDGQYDEALATLDETKTLASGYGVENIFNDADALIPNVLLRKGSSLLKDKDYANAAAALKELTDLQPENGQAFLLLGQAFLQNGNTADAVAALEKANGMGEAQAAKLLSTTYLKQGQALLKANKNAEAVEALQKSNQFAESANAYKLMASAYTKLGKTKDAIAAYKQYLVVNPNAQDAADINFTIAATAQKAGDKATATEYYKKLAGTKYAAQAEAQLKVLQ